MSRRPLSFQLRGVTVRYADTLALDDIDLEVAVGEAVGLVGPSGAGKTTLLRLLNGTLRPTSGSIHIDGQDLAEMSARQLRRLCSRLGTVHQDLRLIPNVRALRNVLAGRLGRLSFLAGLRLLLLPPSHEIHRVHALLERVGIEDKLFQRTDRLSGGQQQRVAIARALYQRPMALLPDEPISALDPARSRDTMALLLDVCRESQLTLCTSLHDLGVARAVLPRLVGLRAGRIVFDQRTETLRDADFRQLFDLGNGEMLPDDG